MTGKRSFVMAVAQMGAVNLDDSRASVVARLVEMLKEGKNRGAQFVVFPELALTTFFPRYWMGDAEAQARFFEQTLPSTETSPLFDTARDLGVGFYLGYAELTPEGTPYNSAVIVRPDGSIAGKYRKIHLPGHSDHKPEAPFQHLEKKYFEVGDLGFRVHNVPLGDTEVRMGMCLCNDRRWPETYRVMALQSAEVVVLGYNTPSLNIHWNEPVHLRTTTHLISLQANAYQNGLWVAAAAKCGSEDGHHMIGSSVIVAPTGEIVARAVSEEDEVITANVDLSLGEMFREHVFNFAKHRRPEHYKLITERTGAGAPVK
ncbi:N-carbamoyl-D-amino-acid hydrolase [Corticibacter populi]|uniref:N-carbamoyl-D-amino-acid hydrolase n=1 Tax=Corticibacter populi TaxID=1550736 RepID=A0A3M6QS06_9BURK|nr:N-carbamoyl-D-amino-acid hydrolase [Corticibacter populi]RMX05825.1 N-carbamoyl-D-amino-acid hydrolase [Corticibacter populi]RZS30861.1 putative amidohydrolase [Corticibacter populi]